MKLQVTENVENVVSSKENSTQTTFNFTNGQTVGKLNYGTVFKAEMQPMDKSVKVSLIRQTDGDNFEIYDGVILYASKNTVTFSENAGNIVINLTFKLTK